MGEAKILVEMELDKTFPKLIACNHKQASFTKATSEPIEIQEDGSNVPMVSIDQFGSNDSSTKPTPSQDNYATIGSVHSAHVDVSNALEKMNDAQEEMRSTTREAVTLQVEDLSPVKEVP
ncbi:hypothetical protein F2Q70_00035184 [Brassica cretica]|uniref:Uncharacterized protein n=1 Tax=Brassica cretica TaxID=69181 RepID=A0A8S9JTY2_BRACR|nr:hypothetical protein F2Q70_00035184 [Brassica cretica]